MERFECLKLQGSFLQETSFSLEKVHGRKDDQFQLAIYLRLVAAPLLAVDSSKILTFHMPQ
jgi:hypothetical protein